MAKRGTGADEAPSGLHRLPPGRHGLSREFVATNQRDRLTAGTIAAVAEHGYHETTITQIAGAAGVSRRTFYVYFTDKRECYLAAFDQIAVHLRQVAEEAAAREADWPSRVAARIGAALAALAANPQLARFTLAVPPRAGGELAAHHRDALECALAELTEGMPTPPAVRPPSQAVQHALIGGVAALIVDEVEAGRGERLADLAPDLVELFLTPFVGRPEAVRLAAA